MGISTDFAFKRALEEYEALMQRQKTPRVAAVRTHLARELETYWQKHWQRLAAAGLHRPEMDRPAH